MDWWSQKFFFSVLLIVLGAAIDAAEAMTMVSGTVFCDQCKDGQRSLFDYPVSGIRVGISCGDGNGENTMSREETTNWMGSYVMRFDGTPDMNNCFAQVLGNNGGSSSSDCNAVAGPPQKLRLMFQMFGMEMYAVDSLLTQPPQPTSSCPRSSTPTPLVPLPPGGTPPQAPLPPSVTPPQNPSAPPFRFPPMPGLPTPSVPLPPGGTPPQTPSAPPFRFPPMPGLPPLPPMPRLPPLPSLPPMPPMPFVEASACPHQRYTMSEYRCYWRALNPSTKVAIVFGPIAARRYGTDLTLWQGLQGRGDPYRTLLREATTALLNSYNSLRFPYNTVSVVTHMNSALMGSERSVLLTALRFIRANTGIYAASGSSQVTCKFSPCK